MVSGGGWGWRKEVFWGIMNMFIMKLVLKFVLFIEGMMLFFNKYFGLFLFCFIVLVELEIVVVE